MEDNNQFKNILLPKTNENEDLETISELALMPLFDTSRFELCTKDKRDKGIDITYQTKKEGSHLGFRFIIQLKATGSIKPNKDGSISKTIETSNINFLLHNNNTAYYILYDHSTKTLYYENLYEFIKNLLIKDPNWEQSNSHTLRFSKKLTPENIDRIYTEVIELGFSQRKLRLQGIQMSSSLNPNDRISLNSELKGVGDSEIRRYIEELGFQLINEGKWNRILELNIMATGNVASSSLYNLILGVANYYVGNRWEAITYFKRAKNDLGDLSEEQQFQLLYFDSTIRFSIGLIDKNEYQLIMQQLEQSKSIGLYIKLFRVKQNYLDSFTETDEGDFQLFHKQIDEIINSEHAHEAVVLTAKCELILYQGRQNNHDYLVSALRLKAIEEATFINMQSREYLAKQLIDANLNWSSFVQEVLKVARNCDNIFAYYMAVTNEVIVSFEFLVYNTHIKDIIPLVEISVGNEKSIDLSLNNISEAASFFGSIGHVENTILAISTKYEILKFRNQNEEANKLMVELEELINQNDFSDYKERLESLKNGGCTHELFRNFLDEKAHRGARTKAEFEELINEMDLMDENENSINKRDLSNSYCIHLFPIGYFRFPKTEKNKVFEILNISVPELIENFERKFDMFIPIANILHESIFEEGYAGGNLADKGIESWRNIHRVRKAFYENGFYRHEIAI